MSREHAVQRIIQDVKSSDSRVQITGIIKEVVDNDYIILKDKSDDIKIDIKNIDFAFQKGDLITVIGELNINVEGEKEVEAEIICYWRIKHQCGGRKGGRSRNYSG